MQNIIEKLQNKQNLNKIEAGEMQNFIISGKMGTEDIIEIFKLFDAKGICEDELIGIINATREAMVSVNIDFDCLDNCGTGGDGFNTFNISTASSFVCAACDAMVAKHGNRAATSKCGAADVLEAIGVNINLDELQVRKCFEEVGMAFMFAPLFHPALKFVREARVAYGKRTYFNMIGPMMNPAHARYQLLGVNHLEQVDLMGNTLINTGSERVLIVHGMEGIDEISVAGDTKVIDFSARDLEGLDSDEIENLDSRVLRQEYIINPSQFKLDVFPIEEVQGSMSDDPETAKHENAQIILDILNNKGSEAQVNAVLLNAAGALFTFGRVADFAEGINLAREVIQNGKAIGKLQELVEVSNKV